MMADNQNQCNTTPPLQKLMLALCLVGTTLILWRLIKYSAYGIDFTDESFYLTWMLNPFIYQGSVTQFGFVYYPIYKMLDGNIATLRQANITITFALSWWLVYVYMRSIAGSLKENRIILLSVSAALATGAFNVFSNWLPTPSYNSLNLQALLLTAVGLILAEKKTNSTSVVGWTLIGIGGWLTFMAKPSTALVLAVGVCIYLPLARKLSIWKLALAVTCTLILLASSALMIDGSVMSFVKRIQLGSELATYLDGGHTVGEILRIDDFQLSTSLKYATFLLCGIVYVAIWSMYTTDKRWSFTGLLIAVVFFVYTAWLMLGQNDLQARLGLFQGLLVFSLVYAMGIAVLVLGGLPSLRLISGQQWAIGTLFLVMPHIYAFGTNNNYWVAGSGAAVFWLLAGLTLLGPLIRGRGSWLLALPIAIATQAVLATLLQAGFEEPYRQPQALRLNASVLQIGPHRSELVLSEGYARYFSSVESVAREAGFRPAIPMIDLSGQSPGVLYSIGSESIGQAWTIGGYTGSLKLAEVALTRTSCEKISLAWILFERDGPRSIPPELMHSLGADFPRDYKHVGTWQTAEGAGGYPESRTQDLYKPVDEHKTLMTCQKLREKAMQ